MKKALFIYIFAALAVFSALPAQAEADSTVALRAEIDRLTESVRLLRQTAEQNAAALAKVSAEAKQNAAAIEDMRKRFNQLIDAVK